MFRRERIPAAGHPLRNLFACATTTRELPLTATLLKIGLDARPGASAKPKPPTTKHLPKPRRRRPHRWHVTPLPKPTQQALTLRTALTKTR